ncbi:conserved hypothetical protein, partial [Ricinus communis]
PSRSAARASVRRPGRAGGGVAPIPGHRTRGSAPRRRARCSRRASGRPVPAAAAPPAARQPAAGRARRTPAAWAAATSTGRTRARAECAPAALRSLPAPVPTSPSRSAARGRTPGRRAPPSHRCASGRPTASRTSPACGRRCAQPRSRVAPASI